MRFQKFQRARRQRVASDENDAILDRTARAHQRVVERRPVQPGHAQIANHQIVAIPRNSREPILAIERRLRFVPFFLQHVNDQLRHRRFIFHHENSATRA